MNYFHGKQVDIITKFHSLYIVFQKIFSVKRYYCENRCGEFLEIIFLFICNHFNSDIDLSLRCTSLSFLSSDFSCFVL